jgi:hypothetical protein
VYFVVLNCLGWISLLLIIWVFLIVDLSSSFTLEIIDGLGFRFAPFEYIVRGDFSALSFLVCFSGYLEFSV